MSLAWYIIPYQEHSEDVAMVWYIYIPLTLSDRPISYYQTLYTNVIDNKNLLVKFSPTGPILKLAKTIATGLQRCFLVVGSLKIGKMKKKS